MRATVTRRRFSQNSLLGWTLLAAGLVPVTAVAQGAGKQAANSNRIAVPLSRPAQPPKIVLHALMGNITVHGYDGQDVIIEGSGGERERPVPEEARDMKRLNQAGGLSVEEDNNIVTIHEGFNGGNVDVQAPAGSALSLKVTNGSVQVQRVVGEMDLESTNGGITLDQVGGSIVAHSLNGRLTATVVRLDSQKPSSFSTLNGRIDLTLPAELHANLNMRSDQGDIYLDQGFDFKPLPNPSSGAQGPESHGMIKLKLDNTARGAINGGGVEVSVRSFNGSILIHKGK